jgi:hypothetical protein
MSDDHLGMGDAAYNYLAQELHAAPGQWFRDFLGCPPLSENSYDTTDLLSPTSSHHSYGVSPSTLYAPTLICICSREPSDVSLSETIFPSLLSLLLQCLLRPHPAQSITILRHHLTHNQVVAMLSPYVSAAARDIAAVHAMKASGAGGSASATSIPRPDGQSALVVSESSP